MSKFRFASKAGVAMNVFAALSIMLLSAFGVAQAGEITVYTSYEEDELKAYLDDFRKVAPDVKVNVLRLSTGDLGARMLAESSNPKHDLIWGWALTNMVDPRIQTMAESYTPPGFDKLDAKFRSPDKKWFAVTGYMAAFCVNTDRLKQKNLPEPKSWNDLLNPVYKGEIVMPNPASSGTGYLQIVALLQGLGEDKGWKMLKDLDGNIGQYIKSGSKPCKAAMAGEYAIGASYEVAAVKAIKEGYPVKMVIPSEGAGYELEASALMKTSKNKQDAKRLLDWSLSERAAPLYAATKGIVTVPGAKLSQDAQKAGLPADVAPVLFKMDFAASARDRDRILARWQKEIER